MDTRNYPDGETLSAFGIVESPVSLGGGEGTSYLAGKIVLKPVDNEDEAIWKAQLMDTIVENGFRVAKPVKTLKGEWTHKGWQAFAYILGHELKGRWEDKIATSRKFHRALKNYSKPSFISSSMHPWGIADRMVWEEQQLIYSPRLTTIMEYLQSMKQPINMQGQLIHGDMSGNILFYESLPPGVIDLSPYWRPAEYANAVIIVDSIVWERAPDSLFDQLENKSEMNQLLIRAAMWRIVTTELHIAKFGKGNINDVDSYNHFIDVLSERMS